MRRNGARRNATDPAALTDAQVLALDALLAGATVADAAAAAGVDRSTLWRWRTEVAAFEAALNAGRAQLREAYQGRLYALADRAVATVEAAVQGGDVKAALAVLKGLELLARVPIGATDPEVVQRQNDNARLYVSLV